jgi:cell shape-determining protein MreC
LQIRIERLETGIRHVVDDSPGTPDSVKEYLRRLLAGKGQNVSDYTKLAHQAVTEGVNLKYVEKMRKALYEADAELTSLRSELEQARKELEVATRERNDALRQNMRDAGYRDALEDGNFWLRHVLETDGLPAPFAEGCRNRLRLNEDALAGDKT